MGYFYNTFSEGGSSYSNNIENNQNYIVNDSIKSDLTLRYHFSYKSRKLIHKIFLFIFIFFIKEILIDKLKIKSKTKILLIIYSTILIFSILIGFGLSLVSTYSGLTLLLFNGIAFYLAQRLVSFFDSEIKILGFRKGTTTYRRTYSELLITSCTFNKKSSNKKYYTYILYSIFFGNVILFSFLSLFKIF